MKTPLKFRRANCELEVALNRRLAPAIYPEVGKRVLSHYRGCAHDGCHPALIEFYRALRASVRAKVAAWHLKDELTADAQTYWRGRAYWYLDAAAASLGINGHRSAIASCP